MIAPTEFKMNHHPSSNLWVENDGRVYKTTYDLIVNGQLLLNYRPNGTSWYIDLISDHSLRTGPCPSKVEFHDVDYVRLTPDHRLGPSKFKGDDRINEQLRYYSEFIPTVKGIRVDGHWIVELDAGYSLVDTDLIISKTFPFGVTALSQTVIPDFDMQNIIRVLTLNSEFPDVGNIA